MARSIPAGQAKAAVLAEIARLHTADPAVGHARFDDAIGAVYEIADRLPRDAAYHAAAEQAVACGCLERLARLVDDPRGARR